MPAKKKIEEEIMNYVDIQTKFEAYTGNDFEDPEKQIAMEKATAIASYLINRYKQQFGEIMDEIKLQKLTIGAGRKIRN